MPNCAVPLAVERNCVVREIDPGYATLCETKRLRQPQPRPRSVWVQDVLKTF